MKRMYQRIADTSTEELIILWCIFMTDATDSYLNAREWRDGIVDRDDVIAIKVACRFQREARNIFVAAEAVRDEIIRRNKETR